MKRIIAFFLSLILLILLGCRERLVNNNEDAIIESPSITVPDVIADENGVVQFANQCIIDYSNAAYYDYKEVEAETTSFVKKNIGKQIFFNGELRRKNAVRLYDTHIDESTIKKCADWISALYDTQYYQSKELMEKNITKRYELLNSDFSKYLSDNGIMQDFINCNFNSNIKQSVLSTQQMPNENQYANYNVLNYIEYFASDKDQNLKAITFETFLRLKSLNAESIISENIKEKDYFLSNFHYNEDGIAQTWVLINFMVVLNQNNEIVGWCELYDKESTKSSTRYFIASENNIELGQKHVYLDLTVHDSFKHTKAYTSGEKGRKAQETAIECYKYFVNLNADAKDGYFDSIYNHCSENFKKKLISSTILEQMVKDAKKYNIKIELDPLSKTKIDQQVSTINVHENTDYGNVYIVNKNVYIKSGNNEFNSKYGLPPDSYSTNFTFYISFEGETAKLIGFKISSSARDNPLTPDFVNLDEVWKGIWDKG